MSAGASSGQEAARGTRVFISYSRKNREFTDRLAEALAGRKFTVDYDNTTIDPDNIDAGISAEDDWWKRLQEMIAACEAMIFVVSPESAASQVCDEEIAYARALGKRVIPILLRPIDFSKAPPRLAALNVKLSFEEESAFESSLAALSNALDLDVAWHREGARLTSLAVKWDSGGRVDTLLLPGGAAMDAEAWAVRRPAKADAPGELLGAYFSASSAKAKADRERLLTNIGRAYVKPAEQALAEGRYDAALRLAAAGMMLSEDEAMRLVPERAEAVLQAAKRNALRAVLSHRTELWSSVYSPNSAFVATTCFDGVVRVWDARTGREVATLRGHSDHALSAAFDADGKTLLTGSSDGTARLWDWASAREIARFNCSAPGLGVVSVAFSADKGRALTLAGGAIKIWDTTQSAKIATISSVNSVVFSRDGERLAAAQAGSVRICSTKDGQVETTLASDDPRAMTRSVVGASFSRDGARLVTPSREAATIWDAATGQAIAMLDCQGGTPMNASFSPDGARIAVSLIADADNPVLILDVGARRQIAALRGHTMTVETIEFSPEGTRVLTSSLDGSARLWDAADGREIAAFRGHDGPLRGAIFSHDGTQVATASKDGMGRLWDPGNSNEISVLRYDSWVEDATFSPDGKTIATASDDRTVRLWDPASGREIGKLAHENSVTDVAFSQDGQRIVTASKDHMVFAWDRTSSRRIASFGASYVRDASFSPDGKRVLCLSGMRKGGENLAHVWEISTGREVARLSGHEDVLIDAVFSPDGERIVTTASDDTMRLWDAANGQEVGRLSGPERAPSRVAFSPDGKRIVGLLADSSIWTWEAATTRGAAVRPGKSRELWTHGAMSYDGRRVAAVGFNGVAVWDVASGAEVASLAGMDFRRICFSPDGKRLFAASAGRAPRVWNVERMSAQWGDVAEVLAASLSHGRGRRTEAERKDLLMEASPDDLYEALMARLTPEQRLNVAKRTEILSTPLTQHCYLGPSQRWGGIPPPVSHRSAADDRPLAEPAAPIENAPPVPKAHVAEAGAPARPAQVESQKASAPMVAGKRAPRRRGGSAFWILVAILSLGAATALALDRFGLISLG